MSAFFEMATPDALAVLPAYLQPIEVRHQRSVLSVTAFLFEESEVGPYTELMFAVIVPPMVAKWGQHAKAGFYPFLAATSSERARRQRAERYHFRYLEQDIDAQFIETEDRIRVRAWSVGKPVVDFSVTQGAWESTSHLLQGFTAAGDQRFRTTVQISGEYTVHENERGTMTLFPHPMIAPLLGREVSAYPFREHWFKNGTEVFYGLEAF
ncbi:MAG: hypothetical protein LJF06_11620 [Gemmatimonadetes bacterium]|nr:hypothetical protein [Gemmatimonadota bacterium]